MSNSLDSLGWSKVFIDVRDRIPISIPTVPLGRRDSKVELRDFVSEQKETGAFDDAGRVLIESRKLVELMNPSESLNFPLGHTVMVANSKSPMYATINKRGKPVMDMLANDLVDKILDFDADDAEEEESA